METTHFSIGLFGCVGTCWMTARLDDCPAGGCSAGWLPRLVGCPAGGLNGGRAEWRDSCPPNNHGVDTMSSYMIRGSGHKKPLFSPPHQLLAPHPAPNGKSLKISHSSQFFGKIKYICPVVMNFFYENQKKCLPATPCWRKHIFAPKWWNW